MKKNYFKGTVFMNFIVILCLSMSLLMGSNLHTPTLQPLTDYPYLTGDELFFVAENNSDEEIRKTLFWDWSLINDYALTAHPIATLFKKRMNVMTTEEKSQDMAFILGCGTSSHQIEGNCCNNTQYLWEKAKIGTIEKIQALSGVACDGWARFKEQIDLVEQANLTGYRMSLEWSKIQPRKPTDIDDGFDYQALAHYQEVCRYAHDKGIKILITLHHYTDPIWFALEGGFEEEASINYFANYAQKAFEYLGDYVNLWVTFNGPSAYASRVYVTNVAPPLNFKKLNQQDIKDYKKTGNNYFLIRALKKYTPKSKDFYSVAQVIKNVLFAHVAAYQAIKSSPNGASSKVGILKNICQVDPWNASGLLDGLGTKITQNNLDQPIFNFFKTGIFTVKSNIPVIAWINENHPHPNKDQAKNSLDFIGLNYYSNKFIQGMGKIKVIDENTRTQNPDYTVYPEGLYRAIKTIYKNMAEPLNIPIYITENGIASVSDEQRDDFLKRYTFVIGQAVQDGYPINGYFHWSLLDNYEWGSYQKGYGIYKTDFSNFTYTLKPGSQHLIDLAAYTFG